MRLMESNMRGLPTRYFLDRDPELQALRRLGRSMHGGSNSRDVVPGAVLSMIESAVRAQTPARRDATSLPTLRARFFGNFELLRDGEVVALGGNRKTLTILKYLLANRSRMVSQDHLMGWLWPESNLRKARWSLNSAVHSLRKLLSEGLSAPVNYVLLEEGNYRLCSTIHVETDVDEFDARYEEGLRLEKTKRTQEAANEYEKAVELYRGDYLLEDLYEDWTMVERERLSNAYVDMLDRLALHYMKSGQLRESIRSCYRLLEVDRSYEASYRLLMLCYASLGLRGKALRHYRLCEEVLEKAYNRAPEPETKALYRSVIGGSMPRV
jgi:LuxR family transcriptional regulator, maltose regulon positive regulatory protein